MHNLKQSVIPAFLLLCIALGGASAAGLWSNVVLQLIGLTVILWAMYVRRDTPLSRATRQALAILALILVYVVLQLVPLPPGIWTGFPGRDEVQKGFALLHLPLPWLPISLDPYATIASALWLLPAVAVFVGIAILGAFRSPRLGWAVASATVASVAVGALQVSGGADSPFYFYRVTNRGFATGFFANANHMATLLVVTIPFVGALFANGTAKTGSLQKSSALVLILVGLGAVVLVGLAINNSLAGIGLFAPVTAATFLLIKSRKKRLAWWWGAGIGLLLLMSTAIIFTGPFNNNLTGAQARLSQESRYSSFSLTWEAARDYFPVGSGIGTFQRVYRQHEDPASVTRTFMNHAHNDYLELFLETGIAGILLMVLFLGWWFTRVVAIWGSAEASPFERAATIASAAILAHCAVDYPLRTVAISAIFAMCCALMADPRASVRRSRRSLSEQERPRHLSAD